MVRHIREYHVFYLLGLCALFGVARCAFNVFEGERERQPEEVRASVAELAALEADLAKRVFSLRSDVEALDARRVEALTDMGEARLMLKLECRKRVVSMDINKHLENAGNRLTFWVAVDRPMWASSLPGTVLGDDFQVGSFLMRGELGKWTVTVVERKVVEIPPVGGR